MIKAILFDMDGIIIDSERYYMDETYSFMKKMGYNGTEEAIHSVIGTTMEGTYAILYDLLEGRFTIEEIRRVNDEHFTIHQIPYQSIVFDHVVETIKEFKDKGLKVALCSSSPMEGIQMCVNSLGLSHVFDLVVSGEDFKESKPNPEIYQFAMAHLGVMPHEAIVYEDSNLGIAAGKNAGVYTIARRETRFCLDQSRADLIVEDISEFKTVVYSRMKG